MLYCKFVKLFIRCAYLSIYQYVQANTFFLCELIKQKQQYSIENLKIERKERNRTKKSTKTILLYFIPKNKQQKTKISILISEQNIVLDKTQAKYNSNYWQLNAKLKLKTRIPFETDICIDASN